MTLPRDEVLRIDENFNSCTSVVYAIWKPVLCEANE